MNGYLELPDGGLIGARDGLLLGRVAACDVVVDDSKASRRHARLVVEAGVVEVEDLNSSNGTLLNGRPVQRRMLRDGDRIEIGKTVIVYREGHMPGVHGSSTPRATGAAPEAAPAPPAASVFDDDDDLLGGAAAPPAAEPAPPKPTPPKPPPPEPAPPPPPAPKPANVVEFEDEVVEVQTPPPARAPEPAVEVRRPAKAPAPAGARDDDVVASSQRVLQFSKKPGSGGLLGDDLNQMSAGMRAVVVIAALAVGAAIVWGIVVAMG